MFHDTIELTLESGKGGDGSISFRREKYIPKGGPDGGDGGKGGDVVIRAQKQLSDLNHLASVRQLNAKSGEPGTGRKMHGANAEDLYIEVPVGTKVFRNVRDEWRLLFDFATPDASKRILTGGEGGLGNVHYATATQQTPRFAQPGQPGQRAHFKFELQLIADVGIIGKPNAGKSTFLSIISDAKPKIANYPFTTLSPVLGVIEHNDKRFVAADIPGIIEGASQGKGLGHTFLRHIQRTKLIVHFIDILSPDYATDYQQIRAELVQFDPLLAQKTEFVVITKGELLTPDMLEEYNQKIDALKKVITPPSTLFKKYIISSVSRLNTSELLTVISEALASDASEDAKDLTN
jgi:GTPase